LKERKTIGTDEKIGFFYIQKPKKKERKKKKKDEKKRRRRGAEKERYLCIASAKVLKKRA
jgi:hypothetical protein